MLPNKPPYFYECNSCGKTFISSIKPNLILEALNIKKNINPFLKCPNCKSRDIKPSILNKMIHK